jgi:hypothetical protein
MSKSLSDAMPICCELCTDNVLVGTIWKVKLRKGKIIICSACWQAVLYGEKENYDGRLTAQKEGVND